MLNAVYSPTVRASLCRLLAFVPQLEVDTKQYQVRQHDCQLSLISLRAQAVARKRHKVYHRVCFHLHPPFTPLCSTVFMPCYEELLYHRVLTGIFSNVIVSSIVSVNMDGLVPSDTI